MTDSITRLARTLAELPPRLRWNWSEHVSGPGYRTAFGAFGHDSATDQPATERRVLNDGPGRRIALFDVAQFAIAGPPREEGSITQLDVVRSGDIVHASADLSPALEPGVPVPLWTPKKAVADFTHWGYPGAAASTRDVALDESAYRGLTKGGK